MSNYPPSPPSSKQPTKRNIKAGTVVPVIILIACVVGTLYFSGTFDNLGLTGLSATRDIEGTWKTAFSTKFSIATDFNSFGLLEVGYENRTMTWVITSTGQENVVNVHVTFSYSDRHLNPGSGYTPDVSPMDLVGFINGTQLTLTRENQGPIRQVGSVGVFTFTTHSMQGTWHDHWEGVYEQDVYTSTNGLSLIKQ